MDRPDVLRLVVAFGSITVAVGCVAVAYALEVQGHPTPPAVAALAGTALGILSSLIGPAAPPPPPAPPEP